MTDPNRALALVDDSQVEALVARAAPLWPKECTPQQKLMVARLALAYGLDPILGELTIYQGKPWITIDGRLRKAHESGKFRGIVEDRPATPEEYKALRCDPNNVYLWYCSVKHADWDKPNGAYGRVILAGPNAERESYVAKQRPHELARKRALWRALREAWPLNLPGLYEDERISTNGVHEPEPVEPGEAMPQAAATRGQLKAIHVMAREIFDSDEEYRADLQRAFGVTSAKDLTEFQARDYLNDLAERLELQHRPRDPGSVSEFTSIFCDKPTKLDAEPETPGPEVEPQPEPEPTEPTEQPDKLMQHVQSLKSTPDQGHALYHDGQIVDSAEVLACEGCGVVIEAIDVQKPGGVTQHYEPEQVVEISQRDFGRSLCVNCYRQERKRRAK